MEPTIDPDPGFMRRAYGWSMLVVALILAGVVIYLWQHESERVTRERTVAEYTSILAGEHVDASEANRAPAIGVGVVGGLLFLGGCILLAGAPPAPPRQRPPASDPGGLPH